MTLIDTQIAPDVRATCQEDEDVLARVDLDEALGRYRRELHVHCYRMLGSYTDAEDMVQEAFVRAWRRRDAFEPGTNLRAWLYRVATNVCIDAIRARRRHVDGIGSRAEATWLEPYPDVLLDQLADAAPGPEPVLLARETIELAFVAALQGLPARQRAVLVMSAGLGWTPGEVAGALEMTTAAVNSALQRAERRSGTACRRTARDGATPRSTTPSGRCCAGSSRFTSAATP